MGIEYGFAADARQASSIERRMTAAADVRCFMIGDRSVLFSERLQQLFELNDSAAAIWRALAAGEGADAVADGLARFGLAREEAQAFVSDATSGWIEAGLLVPQGLIAPSREVPDAGWPLRIGAFDCRLDIRVAPSDPVAGAIRSVFAQFMSSQPVASPVIAIIAQDSGYFLLADEAVVGMFPAARIVAELKALLTDRLAATTDDNSFLIHAALLARDDEGILLSGPSGAGKTTLSVALAAEGWSYAADDIVRVSPALGFEGVRFSPAIKSGAWPLLCSHVPQLPHLPIHLRRDGQTVRYLPIDGSPPPKIGRLAWGFLLSRHEGAAAALEPVERLVFLSEILNGAFSARGQLRGDALEALVDRLSAISCRRLIYSDLAGAVGLLRETVHA